jgi:hypothetical protein
MAATRVEPLITRPAHPTARGGWAGPGAVRTLRAGGAGTVAISLARAAYVRFEGGGWLLLAAPRAPLGPLTLLVAGLPSPPAPPGAPVSLEGAELVVGDARVDLTAVRTPAPVALPRRAPELAAAATAALARRPAAGACLRDGLAALRAGDLAAAVAGLAGRGDGLTPEGDDVLAGYAAWRHADGAPVALTVAAADHTGPLGLAYLDCAQRGELPEPALRVLRAVRGGDVPAAARAADALDRWGASSGSALLWGIAAGALPPHAAGGAHAPMHAAARAALP